MKEYYITFRCFKVYLLLFFCFTFDITSQEEYSPEDPANPCVNYPTEEYESYADCDDHFVRSFLPPGLKPFWTVDNISEATTTFDLELELFYKTRFNLGTLLIISFLQGFLLTTTNNNSFFQSTYSLG